MSNQKRDTLRAKILAEYKPKKEIIKFMGADVEVRQPSLRALLDAQDTGTTAERIVELMLQFIFVPETGEHLFDAADKDVLLNLPWNEDIANLQTVIGKLSGIDMDGVSKELSDSPLESAS